MESIKDFMAQTAEIQNKNSILKQQRQVKRAAAEMSAVKLHAVSTTVPQGR